MSVVIHLAVQTKDGTPSGRPAGADGLEQAIGVRLGNPGTRWSAACGPAVGSDGARVCSGERSAVTCPKCLEKSSG